MLSRRVRRRALGAVVVLIGAGAPLRGGRAQLVQQCVNGAPQIPAGVATAGAAGALERLAWRSSHDAYATLTSTVGPVATLDTIAARTDALLALAGDVARYAAAADAFRARLAVLRAGLGASVTERATGAGPLPRYADLAPAPGDPNAVQFVRVAGGPRLALAFDSAAPLPAIALCAGARTVASYLDFLAAPELQRVADAYASAVRRWDVYVAHGYSMTFVERLGNSCRLGPANWIVAPTVAGRCGGRPWRSLGPPAVRVVFVHPSGGLAPVFDRASTVRTVAVTEWYGLVATPFVGDRMRPFGASFATTFPTTGRPQPGVLVHTPLGKVGAFRAGDGVEGKRGRFVVSADLVGWVPGNRSKTAAEQRRLLAEQVAKRLLVIAKP